jgi:hypothetical protein
MRGHPPTDVPENFARLSVRSPSAELVNAAIRGVDAILDESSDLHELWKDTEDDDLESDYNQWLASVRDIRKRLTQP